MSRLRAYKTDAVAPHLDVTPYTPLVRKLAGMMISRLPASVELDDLVQVGLIGLIEASQQFDAAQGVLFETFASQRIRGAMLDELRRLDWLPRQARRNARQIEEAITRLEQEHGRPPREEEVADRLQMTLADYQSALFDCKGHQLLYYEDFASADEDGSASAFVDNVADTHQGDPLETLRDGRFRQQLVEVIGQLPERDQLVMSLYYQQELNLKEIGAVLGVTESRVSQLHSQAVARIRARLQEWL